MSPTPSPAFDASALDKPSASFVDKAQGERHKLIGNAQMSAERYEQAIDSYTKAISSDPSTAAHYSNRAAAHSTVGDHQNAIKDAEEAIKVDPSFVKAYQRLG
jgi:small glutamine-rich tetratricopeptide repeat-containing protein alpha